MDLESKIEEILHKHFSDIHYKINVEIKNLCIEFAESLLPEIDIYKKKDFHPQIQLIQSSREKLTEEIQEKINKYKED